MYGGGFANGGSPSLALLMSKDPEGLNDIARFDGEAKVYPNPVADKVNVSLSLNKLSTKVSYEIVDITGKSIAMSTKSNVKNDVYTYNTNKLSNGTYFVNIVTESGKTQLNAGTNSKHSTFFKIKRGPFWASFFVFYIHIFVYICKYVMCR